MVHISNNLLGSYGEQGAVIIHQILYDMFPLGTIDPDLVRPFTPNEFILRILVPEVGMRLIIQDMSLSVDSRLDKKRAVAVLRASARYGVAMFPVDGGDNNGDNNEVIGVGDQIIMQRAQKRRKEIEIEEGEEAGWWDSEQEKKKKKKQAKKKAEKKPQNRRKSKQTSRSKSA